MTRSGLIAVTFAVLGLTVVTASAHAMLDRASPPAGATLQTPPSEIHLEFSEALEARFSRLAVVDSRDQDVTVGLPNIAGHKMTVQLKPLPPGVYLVRWRALSVDTHATEGSYRFTIASPPH